MKEEAKQHLFTSFLTFTYDDEHLAFEVDADGVIHYNVCKEHLHSFHRNLWKKYNFRYFVSSEYGPKTGRPHYHGIYYHDTPINFAKLWPYGQNNTQYPANDGSFKYVLKYTLKGSNVPQGSMPNFRLMSRRPGIGSSFVYKGQEYLLTENGVKCKVPNYYNRVYLNSLNDKLRDIIQESKLGYLSEIERHSQLKRSFEEKKANNDFDPCYTFEDYISDLYKKDFNKQIKINKK